MVPFAVGSVSSFAFDDGLDSVTVKVSSPSSVASFTTGTSNVPAVSPIATVTVPVFVVPRSAATAVSPVSIDAVQVAVTAVAAASDSVTVNSTFPSFSASEASAGAHES